MDEGGSEASDLLSNTLRHVLRRKLSDLLTFLFLDLQRRLQRVSVPAEQCHERKRGKPDEDSEGERERNQVRAHPPAAVVTCGLRTHHPRT